MNWKIYYGDGSTFSDVDGTPSEAPPTNVQVIAQANETVGRELITEEDFYIQRKGEWIGIDLSGLLDQLMEMGILKCGRMLTREEWEEVKMKAMNDTDLPRKSARFPDEKR